MNKILKIVLLLVFTWQLNTLAQYSDPALHTRGFHTGNRVGISYYNDGQIAGFNTGVDIRGEWPLGSGENYIGDCIPLIGVEFFNELGDTLQSVVISRGPRNGQFDERHPINNYFWGFNPTPGFRNPNYESVAMSHLPESWPIEGWNDPVARSWKDEEGKTQWFGYFGRGIDNADQESFYEADDHWDDEFNAYFHPDSNDLNRNGMALRMRVRGFQWSSFLAEDAIFWLYDISNDGTTLYRKADFGTIVGTLAGGDGDSQDDLGDFDIDDWITYSYDSDNVGNKGQKVGYVGYAFLESPGNPFDGIDNDDDSQEPGTPRFTADSFDEVVYNAGDQIVLIEAKRNGFGEQVYERTLYTVKSVTDTVVSLGTEFIIEPGVTVFREGHIASTVQGVAIPDVTANDAIDNDLDGVVDENEATHYYARSIKGLEGLAYINYVSGEGMNDLLIDERRDNDVDEDGDWNPEFDDVGADGLGPDDDNYPGPDMGEGDGFPTQGEPNFGKTDTDESDQIGLTNFNFFQNSQSPDLSIDSLVWNRMTPGRFDVIPPTPMDGDFIYSSGYFPLFPKITERFSVSLLFGEDRADIVKNKKTVLQIYNSGYKFPKAPKKPEINITQEDGKVVLYWNGEKTENSRDFVTKTKDFQGYKIYRSTDANFRDARTITNAVGVLSFDEPIAQYDKKDSISGFYYPNRELLESYGGISYYLGDNTGIVNKYVDSNVVAGQTYYYAVCAFDSGEETQGIFPEENSKFIFRDNTGQITTDKNTGYITPGRRPLGYVPAFSTEMAKSESFIGTGSGVVDVIDDEMVKDGYKYEVAFEDSALQGYTKNWSLIDKQTPDTVFVPSINETYIVNPLETINLPANTDSFYVNGTKKFPDTTFYTASYDTLVNKSNVFYGNTPTHHGFRVQLYNDNISVDTMHSGFQDLAGEEPGYTFKRFVWSSNSDYSGINNPNDYEIEFFDEIVGQSVADTLWPPISSNRIPAQDINFKVKNLTTGEYIDVVYVPLKTALSTKYNIWFKERIKGEYTRTWQLIIFYNLPNVPLESEGKMVIRTSKPFNQSDKFTFTLNAADLNKDDAKASLDKIKVVPNPYVVTHAAEARLLSTQTSGRGEREIRFTYIPPNSKISIYTVRGELIKTLYHDDLYVGDVFWNLRTDENMDVAYGIYVYVVEAEGIGTKIDKFALIK